MSICVLCVKACVCECVFCVMYGCCVCCVCVGGCIYKRETVVNIIKLESV